MTIRFSPPLFHLVLRMVCLVFLLSTSALFADDYIGPVFPNNTFADEEYTEPLPLPKRNPLLQRSQSKQVVFDNLDLTDSVIPSSLLYDDEMDIRPQVVRQGQMSTRPPSAIDTEGVFFTDDGTMVQGGIFDECSFAVDGCAGGTFLVPYGMGLLDNITLFSETTAFRTGLNSEGGCFGIGEGINWATAATPQGAVAVQYGIRAVQADCSSDPVRSQVFMTAGLFKRFDCVPVQVGAAADWLEDRSEWGLINLRQMRCEVSTRTFGSLECGFTGGFDVFRDRPVKWYPARPVAFAVHDHYLLFVRKHLDRGGQVELRCGSTAYGDFVLNALGEVAVTDRVAVNGGISLVAPSGGPNYNYYRNSQESWSLSMGVVIYLRGGATFRQMNSYRQMFDVAGNNSFITRMLEF